MTIEEKAKAYDDALERAKEIHKTINPVGQKDIEVIFPELAESEDERIRKEIRTYLHNELHNIDQLTPRTNEFERWIAWLEKQKEQKTEWSLQDEKILGEIFCAIRIDSALSEKKQDELICWLQQYRPYMYKEQKPAEWSEGDEKKLSLIVGIIESYEHAHGILFKEEKLWLKSLRPQSHWKPSKEQMEALDKVANEGALLDLFNDLLKL